MITAISDIGYWMAETTSDNVFDVESDENYLYLSFNSPDTPIANAFIINKNI